MIDVTKRYTIDEDTHLMLLDLIKNKADHDDSLTDVEANRLDNLYWQLK